MRFAVLGQHRQLAFFEVDSVDEVCPEFVEFIGLFELLGHRKAGLPSQGAIPLKSLVGRIYITDEKSYIFVTMKQFLYFALLLAGLAGCAKKADDTPTPQAPLPFEGKWAKVKEVSTDGQTSTTNTWNVGAYFVTFIGNEYVSYSGMQEMARYPYTFSNNLIYLTDTKTGASINTLTIQTLTATTLVLTFPGAGGYSNFKFTTTYERQ